MNIKSAINMLRLSSLVISRKFFTSMCPLRSSICQQVHCRMVSGTSNFSQQRNIVFDRQCKTLQKELCNRDPEEAKTYEYLRNEIAFQVVDRIADVDRDFPLMLDLGCGRGHVSYQLTEEDRIHAIVQGDVATNALNNLLPSVIPTSSLLFDEERLNFKENIFDLVTSCLNLHWVNDLPGCFKKVLKTLKPDGCFLGALLGGDTLFELRCSLQLAETEREGGMAPHVSPLLQGHDLANLLTSAGFNLVTVDMDEIVINYPSIFEVMGDLKGMGENSSLFTRKLLHRDTIAAAASIYKELYGDEDGNVPASYQILYFIGWKPDKSHPKPLERGSTPKGFQQKKT